MYKQKVSAGCKTHFLFLLSFAPPKLTVGLYEFEVAVDGEGAHGEGYVNVTVKPGEDQHSSIHSYCGHLKSCLQGRVFLCPPLRTKVVAVEK